jgi:tetratricopeptide (TPR) repeat protein
MEDYTPTTAYGSKLLNSGKTLEALACFLEVRDEVRQATEGSSSAEIEQLLGICYRMLGRFASANKAFQIAFALTEDRVHRGRIKRDWAMVYLAQRQFATAHEIVDESMRLIGTNDRLEYAATMGFKARVHGNEGDRESARMYYATADAMLQSGAGQDPDRGATYELNNLVWWLKVARGVRRRKTLAGRAWRLAAAAGNRNRQLQIILLLACRPLAVRLAG